MRLELVRTPSKFSIFLLLNPDDFRGNPYVSERKRGTPTLGRFRVLCLELKVNFAGTRQPPNRLQRGYQRTSSSFHPALWLPLLWFSFLSLIPLRSWISPQIRLRLAIMSDTHTSQVANSVARDEINSVTSTDRRHEDWRSIARRWSSVVLLHLKRHAANGIICSVAYFDP